MVEVLIYVTTHLEGYGNVLWKDRLCALFLKCRWSKWLFDRGETTSNEFIPHKETKFNCPFHRRSTTKWVILGAINFKIV